MSDDPFFNRWDWTDLDSLREQFFATTPQSSDPAGWLVAELRFVEQIARDTRQASPRWGNFDMDGELRDWVNAGTVARMGHPQDRAHIALNDPASVLRRVVKTRELLAEHEGTWASGEPEFGYHHETAIGPNGRTRYIEVTDDEPIPPYMCSTCQEPTWPCRTVLGLAEAWGWEES